MEYGLVVVWWVAYVGLGLFGLPVAARLCSSLSGRGAGFSLAISLTIVTLVGFWVGFLALGWVALLAGLAALAICAVVAVRGGVAIDRRAAAEALVVFTVVYLGFLAVRAVDPGITPHGEKFLDFGMMVSAYRAPRLPPEDFWFAGKPVIYYYGGHLLAGFLTRLTGTQPWYGFNLAMAGFYGMLATGAYELAGAVAVSRKRCVEALPDTAMRDGRVVAGVTAVFFTLGAGTLSTAVRLFVGHLPDGIRGGAVRAFASFQSALTASQVSPIPQDYQYKIAGRILPGLYNPFPLFAIIRGDLRPYLLSAPFLLVVAGLCYAYYRTPERAIRRRRVLAFGAISVVAGFMIIVNTWSFAAVLGVVWLTLTFAPTRLRSLLPTGFTTPDSIPDEPTDTPVGALARTAGAVPVTAVVGVISGFVALPFVLGPVRSRPASPLVVLEAGARSPLGSLLLIHGAFLAVFVAYYLGHARTRWNGGIAIAGVVVFVALLLVAPVPLAPLALFCVLLAAGWYFLATDRSDFEGVLIVAGLGLVLLAELVYLKPGDGGRFNTVVKTYMPAWVLWASAVGVILPRLVRGRSGWSWTRRQQIGTVLAAVLVVSTAAFGGVALGSHFTNPNTEQPTLDGMAAAEQNIPGQVEAIRWLYNRSDEPNVVSAPAQFVYRWSASPAASLTGVPTVVGVSHEAQFRGRRAFLDRWYDVNTVYLGSAEQRVALLERYNVEYIYVGPTERIRYGDIRPFTELQGVHVAFRAGNVTIYAVNQNRLSAG